MAIRKRMIDPAFWDDPKVGKLTEAERLFVIACISIADDDGRLVADIPYLRSILYKYQRVTDRQVEKIRDKVCSILRGFLLYEVNREYYIQLRNWKRYQTLRQDLYKKSLYPSPESNVGVTFPLRDRNVDDTQVSKEVSKQEIEDLKKIFDDKSKLENHLKIRGFGEESIKEILKRHFSNLK